MKPQRFFFSLGFLLAILLPLFAWAAPNKVGLEITVIYASEASGGIDASLNAYKADLKSSFKKYKRFQQLSRNSKRIQEKGPLQSLQLPNGQKALFRYDGPNRKAHKLHLAIPQSQVEVDLRMPYERTVFQAGMRYKDGILILAMTLTP